jgi:Carbohydrate-selective porin, OprB family/S-layer homology domain
MKQKQRFFLSKVSLACILASSLSEFCLSTHRAVAVEAKQEEQTEPSFLKQIEQYNQLNSSNSLEQVTSVNQLRDVAPTDWAFEALQSLVERYGCIAGFPNQTYRGTKSLSRYEFAAGLNSCMNQIERLIASSQSVMREDLEKIQRLSEEFQTELAALGTKVDNLDGRVAFLEDHQFSTTTKLNGEAIFSVAGGFGGEPGVGDSQIVLNDRLRLNLNTSFTGKDKLITGIQAYNFGGGSLTDNSSIGEVLFPNDASPLSESMTKLSFEPQFPGVNPQTLSSSCGNNDICLYKLLYIFPFNDKLSAFVGPAAETTDALPTIIPFADEAQGAVSRFGSVNPVLRVSGGTSGTGLASAAGVIFTPSPKIDIRALYASVNAALPNNDGFPGTPLGAGLFNGSYVAATQITLKPIDSLDIGLNYAHSYHQINILGMGSAAASTGVLSGLPLSTPVSLDSFGATLAWRINPKIQLTAYGAYIAVEDATSGEASTDLTSWMAGLYLPDALKEGNSAGLLFGQPLYRIDAGGGASRNTATTGDRSTPYHVEAYYNFKLNDNISITPGAFVIFNPEGDSDNDTTGVAVLRTSFTF